MRVLLVQAYVSDRDILVYPLGLACLAACLQEHQVRTLDLNICSDPWGELSRVLEGFRPEAAGVSLRNLDSPFTKTSYYEDFKRLARQLRQGMSGPLLVGGAGFSLFAAAVMRDVPEFDFGVLGEGEHALPDLLARLGDPGSVPSVYYRRDGEVRFSGPAKPPRHLVSPDASAFAVGDYGRDSMAEPLGVETKRGCPLTCVYCPYGFLNGRELRLKSPAQVGQEVARLAALGARRFTFVDSVFNMPRPHAEAVCREIIRSGARLSWSAWFSEKWLDRGFLDLAVAAGCDHVLLSPDGFSAEALRRLGKSQTLADIRRAMALLRDTPGVEVSCNFFCNPPGQTPGAFARMLAFCALARLRMGPRLHPHFSGLRIEPHTAIRELAVRQGVLDPDDDLLTPRFYSQPRTAYLERLAREIFALRDRLRRR
ncbi:radical SAM protein [Desulfovibrio sulfodismutans]|uniref:Radical SAM protein n=1 Tax=Desulfolutivibrio sulfodismutans TaxID=63561 RepID=A0A7K3NGX9_9BACT|nr:radical SAM protein [Desulfolutivibrio sulfodismutans]NDY55456.1 radical SAM protein [Desulfolutivibrio sulfodismutans]QLA12846.1 radical SAM protein [Desulfolutivibrio sulfodismutans DSM 3696]